MNNETENFEVTPRVNPPMNDVSSQQIVDAVHATLISRKTNNALKSEADFLAGAITVMQAIYGPTDNRLASEIPSLWMFYPMSGRSVLQELVKLKVAEGAAGRVAKPAGFVLEPSTA